LVCFVLEFVDNLRLVFFKVEGKWNAKTLSKI